MKKTILFFPLDLMSHYLRCLSLAKMLGDEYKVLFLASSKYNAFIKDNGFEVFSTGKKNAEQFIDICKQKGLLNFSREETETNYQEQLETMAALKPALVITDLVPTANMAAEKLGIPTINLVNAYLSRYFYKRVELPGYIPAEIAKDIYDVPPFFQKQIETLAGLMELAKQQKALRKVRQKFGLEKRNNIGQELEGVHTWTCDLPGLFPLTNERPAEVRCIGPLFHRSDYSDKTWLKDLDQSKKNILVTLGSTGDVDVLQILRQELFKKYNVIVCGKYEFSDDSPNLFFKAFVNFDEILPEMDLVIAHGGNGTLYQALSHAIPIISIPSFFEQVYNAERVEELELGQTLQTKPSIAELESVIERWIDQKGTSKLAKIAEEIKASEGQQKEIVLQSVREVLIAANCRKEELVLS